MELNTKSMSRTLENKRKLGCVLFLAFYKHFLAFYIHFLAYYKLFLALDILFLASGILPSLRSAASTTSVHTLHFCLTCTPTWYLHYRDTYCVYSHVDYYLYTI